MPSQAKELLARYSTLANEFAGLVKALKRGYTNAFGSIIVRDDGEDTDAWVTCTSNPLVRHYIGCMPGVTLHLRQWYTVDGVVTLVFDRAWTPGLATPVSTYYFTNVSGPLGLTALYSTGLGWVLDRVMTQPHARLLSYLGRINRSTIGLHEPATMTRLGSTIAPRGVGIIGNTLVVGLSNHIGVRPIDREDYDIVEWEDLVEGDARGFDAIVIPFLESMYDALARAYNMVLNITTLLGLALPSPVDA